MYFRYVVMETVTEERHILFEAWCSEANSKFTEPRIKSMWLGKANTIIYRVYKDSSAKEVAQ